jgi:anionic cell wall polymer biosynthesis LytR-Cps2A-Psr (LCP) family protein
MASGRREHRFWKSLLTLLVLFALLAAGGWCYLDRSLRRTSALTGYPGRPAKVAGTNWLLVGADGRAGLSDQRKRQFPGDDGTHLEAVLFVHVPDNGVAPTLVSLPVDAAPPGQETPTRAYSRGGAQLLAQTVEKETNLWLDHFVETGIGGLGALADDIGGVRRPPGVPDRLVRQREYLHALFRQAAKPGVYLNPSHLFRLLSDGPDALTMDRRDSLTDLAHLALALRGDIVSITVPLGPETVWD